MSNIKPNVVFVFADQWRGQATGYAGDPNLQGKTPNLDRLAGESFNFTNAVSNCPVCTPYRASLLTGQYPLTHGLFLNDICLGTDSPSIAHVYKEAGYDTAYIGKWHLDGNGRDAYIPPERRQGFEFWEVLECTHDYNNSPYYAHNDETPQYWSDYDVFPQTQRAKDYVSEREASAKPFILFLSWGPPHNPYETAPAKYQAMFPEEQIILRANVPEGEAALARKELAGYYAHIVAMDDAIGSLLDMLDDKGLTENTIFVFTSDHGDMIRSQGFDRKQRPHDESILVPFLLRYPATFGTEGRVVTTPIGTPDIMPTLLALSGIDIPESVEGDDLSGLFSGDCSLDDNPILTMCVAPFGEHSPNRGGKEYRGIRTRRYTYVKDLDGPWLMFDNEQDSYQQTNLLEDGQHEDLRQELEAKLQALLDKRNDKFLDGQTYIRERGYKVNDQNTVGYFHVLK